jgi:hypothetical protein
VRFGRSPLISLAIPQYLVACTALAEGCTPTPG